jgi:hypothetical protein
VEHYQESERPERGQGIEPSESPGSSQHDRPVVCPGLATGGTSAPSGRGCPSGTRYRRRHTDRCRVGPGDFTPSPSQIPYVNLSIHTARVIARRLPPSAEPSGSSRFDPVGPWSTAMTCPLRSTSITLASTLLQGSPPLSGASVLSASRLEPLAPFPLPSPARFSRSVQEPD